VTTPPDILLGLSPADRAELTRLLVEHEARTKEAMVTGRAHRDLALAPGGYDTPEERAALHVARAATDRFELAAMALITWTRARLALIAAQGPRSTVAL